VSEIDELISILMDLTFYESTPLVSAALVLLVRQFEQRRVLCERVGQVRPCLLCPIFHQYIYLYTYLYICVGGAGAASATVRAAARPLRTRGAGPPAG